MQVSEAIYTGSELLLLLFLYLCGNIFEIGYVPLCEVVVCVDTVVRTCYRTVCRWLICKKVCSFYCMVVSTSFVAVYKNSGCDVDVCKLDTCQGKCRSRVDDKIIPLNKVVCVSGEIPRTC